jgi:hypothetical protein
VADEDGVRPFFCPLLCVSPWALGAAMRVWQIPPDLLVLVARAKARKPRPVQRAEYRARRLERAEDAHRRAGGVLGALAPNPPRGGFPKPRD